MPMIITPKPVILNRYTCLPIALDILYRKQITFLSPDAWEDRNDAYYLERYQEDRKLRSVLAFCLSEQGETFHQWRIFSEGPSGVCIEFDKAALLESIPEGKGYSHGEVKYYLIRELEKSRPELERWPFIKRAAFENEAEYRVIFESKTEKLRAKPLPIRLELVLKVTLSPWMPNEVADSVKRIIRSIDGCAKLQVNRSSLIDNSGWRAIID